jgi:hypothetical protein
LKQQERVEQREGILATGERHRDAVAVANHLEAADGLSDFAEEDLLEVHNPL